MVRKLGLALLVCLVMVGTIVPAQAGPLSGGNTIYVVNGVDSRFTFDPIVRQDGTLVPVELVQALGLTVADAGGNTLAVSRGEVEATLTLGQTVVTVGGQLLNLTPASIRIGGRPFLPVALLEELGYEVTFHTNLLSVRDLL